MFVYPDDFLKNLADRLEKIRKHMRADKDDNSAGVIRIIKFPERREHASDRLIRYAETISFTEVPK